MTRYTSQAVVLVLVAEAYRVEEKLSRIWNLDRYTPARLERVQLAAFRRSERRLELARAIAREEQRRDDAGRSVRILGSETCARIRREVGARCATSYRREQPRDRVVELAAAQLGALLDLRAARYEGAGADSAGLETIRAAA
jgi:hypothetical protein